jgi:hypothetical protein
VHSRLCELLPDRPFFGLAFQTVFGRSSGSGMFLRFPPRGRCRPSVSSSLLVESVWCVDKEPYFNLSRNLSKNGTISEYACRKDPSTND